MTKATNKEIHTLWRTVAAVVTAASIYLAGAPHSAAQVAVNTLRKAEPLPPCTVVGVPGLSPFSLTDPRAFLEQHTSCLSADEIKNIVGSPPTPDLLERLSRIELIANHKPTLMTQPDAITLGRKANGLVQLHILTFDPSINTRPVGKAMFGFNPDPNAKDSVKNMLLKYEVINGTASVPRDKDFSIAWTVLPSQLTRYPINFLLADTDIFKENYQTLLQIHKNNLVTPEGKIDVARLGSDLKEIGEKLHAHMVERNWSILPHQPPIAMLHPPFTTAQVAALDLAAYPPNKSGYGYVFVGTDDPHTSKQHAAQSVGHRMRSILNEFYYDIPGRYIKAPLPDPTLYSNVLKFAENVRAATVASLSHAHKATSPQEPPQSGNVTPPLMSSPGATTGPSTSSVPIPLTNEEMNDIRHIRRAVAEILGIPLNQALGLFQSKAGYLGPVATGAEQILPPISKDDAQKFFACYKDPSCYARKSGKGSHKDWGFKAPSQAPTPHKQSLAPSTSHPAFHRLPDILTTPHGGTKTAELLAPYRERRPQTRLITKNPDR